MHSNEISRPPTTNLEICKWVNHDEKHHSTSMSAHELPNSKTQIEANCQQIPKKNISELIQEEQNQHWSNKLQNITKGNKKLWKLTKDFKGKSDSTVGEMKINGSAAVDDVDRANCLAKTFEKSHTITESYTHETHRIIYTTVRHTVHSFNLFSYATCNTPTIDINEVHNIVSSLRPFKSPGPDTLNGWTLHCNYWSSFSRNGKSNWIHQKLKPSCFLSITKEKEFQQLQ